MKPRVPSLKKTVKHTSHRKSSTATPLKQPVANSTHIVSSITSPGQIHPNGRTALSHQQRVVLSQSQHSSSHAIISRKNICRSFSTQTPHDLSINDKTVSSSSSPSIESIDNTETVVQSPSAPITEHVFLRIDLQRQVFRNRTTVSFPDVTPEYIVLESQEALRKGLKGRPSCDNFQYKLLPSPEFAQTGKNWNRYEYSFAQREMNGSIDPYTLQSILLDHFINKMNAQLVSSHGNSGFLLETVTHVLQFPIYHDITYDGTYFKEDV